MTGFVYFLRCGEFVKIGYSANPKRRLLHLQTATPYDFELLGAHQGSREQEQQLHKIFAHFHHRHEWFCCVDAILDVARNGLPPSAPLPRVMKLEIYLKDHGLTQSEFGKRIGVTQQAINNWVVGKSVPRPQQMKKIAEITGHRITPNDFLASGPSP